MAASSTLEQHWQELVTVATSSATQVDTIISPTAAELPAVIQAAASQQQKILVAGSGSKLSWGGLVNQPTLIVSTRNINRLLAHAVGDLTVTIEAGISFQQLQQQLAKEGQFLPLDPLFPDQATIGGIIATADTGSLRHRYGGVRDLLLGLSWVRPDGAIAKAGGQVVKNVAGYDLMKLFTGAYGTLGIVQQVTLRVYPLPPASGSVWITGANLETLIGKLGASTLTPTALDLLSPALAQQLGLGEQMGILARFQTIPASIAVQSQRLMDWATEVGLASQFYEGDTETTLWQQVRAVIMQKPMTAKIGCRPTAAVTILKSLNASDLGVIHLGSGIGLLGCDRSVTLLSVRQQCEQAGGFLSVLTAPPEMKQQMEVWGYQGAAMQIMRQLRQQFDPQSLFNPGKFFS